MTKTCQHCRVEFVDGSISHNAVFCSYRCRQKVKQARKVAKRRAAILKRSCPQCGNGFETFQDRHVFCSKKCNDRFKAVQRKGIGKCEWCGAMFHPNKTGQRFCSRKCNWTYQNSIAIYKPKPLVEKGCQVCGRHFKARPNRKYCSVPCLRTASHANALQAYRDKHPLETRTCEYCGTKYKDRKLGSVYCTEQCCRSAVARRGYLQNRQTSNFFQMFAAPAVISETLKQNTNEQNSNH
jgi:hypothetical protein